MESESQAAVALKAAARNAALNVGRKSLWHRLPLGVASLALGWAALGSAVVLFEQISKGAPVGGELSASSMAEFRDDDDGDWCDGWLLNEEPMGPAGEPAAR